MADAKLLLLNTFECDTRCTS